MLCVIHVSERQKKKFFFPTWSFIGMFRSVHLELSGILFIFLRYPFSRSLNHQNVLSLFSVVVIPNSSPTIPHVRPHSVPQQFLLNKLAKIMWVVYFCLPLWWDVASLMPPEGDSQNINKWDINLYTGPHLLIQSLKLLYCCSVL